MKPDELITIVRQRLRPGRRTAILLVVNALALTLAAVFFGLFIWASTASTSQRAAALWANGDGERYAQVSVFLADSAALNIDSARDVSDAVSKILKENSISPKNENARLFIDAYSGTAKVGVSSARAQGDALATGIGGDFFFFHGFELLYGSLLDGTDRQPDTVIIDDALAWRLYGASNVVGFEITVGSKLCYVGGVVTRGDKWPDSMTYGETSRIFMHFGTLKEIAPSVGVTCYEAVLPDPVSGFGADIVKRAVNADEELSEIVENSARFGASSLLGVLTGVGKSAMQTKPIAFPYWENAARAAVSYAALLLGATLAALAVPAVSVLALIRKAWRAKGAFFRALLERHRKRQLEKWEKNREKTAEEEVLI